MTKNLSLEQTKNLTIYCQMPEDARKLEEFINNNTFIKVAERTGARITLRKAGTFHDIDLYEPPEDYDEDDIK